MINIEYVPEKDAYLVPKWFMQSLLSCETYDAPYESLTDYGKGVVDTIKQQNETFSINLKR